MRRAILAVHCLLLSLVAGCGEADVKPAVAPRATARHADAGPARVAWTPSIVEDGDMFRDEASFRAYVKGAEVAAVGTLASWEGTSGKLRVERVIRGRAGDELSLSYSGGFIRPVPGQRVIALLSTRNGKLILHSHCAAGGLYAYTEQLASYVESAWQGR